jgi:creatinine amidohydrolase
LTARLERKAILYLPIGSIEWHNEHLPLGTDSFLAAAFAIRLCDRIGGAVLPIFWWNTGGCHDSQWTYHMPEEIYRDTLKRVCLGLKAMSARLLVLVNGHGGTYQAESPPVVAEQLAADGFPMRVTCAYPYAKGPTAIAAIDHADTGETSVAMALAPGLVRLDRDRTPDLFSGEFPFEKQGQPTAGRGERLWEAFLAEARVHIQHQYDLCAQSK